MGNSAGAQSESERYTNEVTKSEPEYVAVELETKFQLKFRRLFEHVFGAPNENTHFRNIPNVFSVPHSSCTPIATIDVLRCKSNSSCKLFTNFILARCSAIFIQPINEWYIMLFWDQRIWINNKQATPALLSGELLQFELKIPHLLTGLVSHIGQRAAALNGARPAKKYIIISPSMAQPPQTSCKTHFFPNCYRAFPVRSGQQVPNAPAHTRNTCGLCHE